MSGMTDEYKKFKILHELLLDVSAGARKQLQDMFPVDREGATKLMLFWAASCLNFGSSCRTKNRKKFDEVLVEDWSSPDKFQKYCERLGKMGINMGGGYEGNDDELVYIKADGSYIETAKHCKYLFLPLFKCWFEEAVEFANKIYPSGIMADAMQSIRTRALNEDKKMSDSERKAQPWDELLGAARPSRDSVTHRVKGEVDREGMVIRVKEKQAAMARAFGMGPEGLKQFVDIKHDDHIDMQKYSIKEKERNMSKTNDFVNSIKGIFGATVRMQRGRATVHAVKRIIFRAFPIQWGILARLTGKAKKVEDHPLTDVAVALLAHGAASALLTDPKKRDKYLCYTEEMVAASVANAGLKMVPVEDILDKVLNGAMDSEAISKLKAVLKDQDQ